MAGQGSALAMTAAYVLAGELGKAEGSHARSVHNYEMLLRSYIDSKQKGAERFSAAFAPKTQWGLFVRNQVIKACAIPGLARLAFGRDILDALQLPSIAGRLWTNHQINLDSSISALHGLMTSSSQRSLSRMLT